MTYACQTRAMSSVKPGGDSVERCAMLNQHACTHQCRLEEQGEE